MKRRFTLAQLTAIVCSAALVSSYITYRATSQAAKPAPALSQPAVEAMSPPTVLSPSPAAPPPLTKHMGGSKSMEILNSDDLTPKTTTPKPTQQPATQPPAQPASPK